MAAKDQEPDLKAFGDALARALNVRGMTQRQFGEALATAEGRATPLSQAAVAGWVSGTQEPDGPRRVFLMEEILELPPGHLAQHLGYLPAAAIDGPTATFAELVGSDPLLDDTQKRMILALYAEATARKPGGRGRPRRRP